MFKVLVWDFTGISAQWLNQVADKKYIDVVATLTPESSDKLTSEILLKCDAWDWLLIFEQGTRQFFDEALNRLKLPLDRVIYALDINSWLEHPKAAFTLTNPATGSGGAIYRQLSFKIGCMLNNFVTCTVEGVSYVGTAADPFRMPYMFVNGINWSAHDMQRFHALAKKYYNIDDGAGYFLDLGANIGTSGIYFVKNLAPNLKLLAFEPDAENFKMHRVNLILNDLDGRATLVNCGLSNEFGELMLYNNGVNPGARSFIKRGGSTPIATVKIIPLDSYLAEHNIAAQDVKYIWIDTEGLEAQVMLGAKNLLAENPAPIFVEFNLGAWQKSGCFDELMTLLEGLYSHFILFSDGKEILYPIDAMRTLTPPANPLGRFGGGDIMLIKKGLIN